MATNYLGKELSSSNSVRCLDIATDKRRIRTDIRILWTIMVKLIVRFELLGLSMSRTCTPDNPGHAAKPYDPKIVAKGFSSLCLVHLVAN